MFAAADTNFFLALASDEDDAIDALETLKVRAPHLPVAATPTPLEELRFFKVQSVDLELKAAATKALACFRADWGFRPVTLTRAQQNRATEVSERLRLAAILPAAERHDSLILAEAALIEARLLVTEDSVLRGADYPRLVLELGEYGLHPPVLATPREIIQKFFR